MTALFLVLSLLAAGPKKPAPTPQPVPSAPRIVAPPPAPVPPPPAPAPDKRVPLEAPYKYTNLNGILLGRGDDMPFDGVAIPEADARTQVLRLLTCEASQHDGICAETCKPPPEKSSIPSVLGGIALGIGGLFGFQRAKAARDAQVKKLNP